MQFPHANINSILGKLKAKAAGKADELRSFFARNDPDGTNSVPCEQLITLLRQMCADVLSDHEILTAARFYAVRPKEEINVSQVGEELPVFVGKGLQESRRIRCKELRTS